MNSKRAIISTVFLLMLIGVLAWKFWPSQNVQAIASVPSTAPRQIAILSKSVPRMTVEAPKVTPAPVSPSAKVQGFTPADALSPAEVELRAELNKRIDSMIALLQAGDFADFLKTSLPPGSVRDMQREGAYSNMDEAIAFFQANPQFQTRIQQLIDQLKQMKDLTPSFDAVGNDQADDDLATYVLDPLNPNAQQAANQSRQSLIQYQQLWYRAAILPMGNSQNYYNFSKINGQWYILSLNMPKTPSP